MAVIRVNPNILHEQASKLSEIGSNVDKIGKDVMQAAKSAPSYDGQFGPRLWVIGIEATTRAALSSGKINGLSNTAYLKAQAFETADMASAMGFSLTTKALIDWQEDPGFLDSLNRLKIPSIYLIELFEKYSGLIGQGKFGEFRTAIINQNTLTIKIFATFLGIKLPWVNTQRSVLTQTNPQGDHLDTKITEYPNGTQEKLNYPPYTITNVYTHIQAYGCLLTAYTMLLRDRDVDVSVTDLYKQVYKQTMHGDFDEDAKKGTVVFNQLYANDSIVSSVSTDYSASTNNLTGDKTDDLKKSLDLTINENSSIILHVASSSSDGHWIVVDHNSDGTLNVRDPLSGESNYTSDKFFEKYTIAPDKEYKSISRIKEGSW
jgi:hypothetical protein